MQLVEQDEIPIKTLIDQGIDAEDVKKLEDAGIYTCNRLIYLTKKYLTGVTGLSEAKVDEIWEAAEKKMGIPILTKNQMKKEQASAALIWDESGSGEAMIISHMIAQVNSVKKDMLKLTMGVRSDSELDFVASAIHNLATSASQFLACRKATFPDEYTRDEQVKLVLFQE
ncbi:unnamed protein product [Microthlaspi erraticum]|uniref:DNA recombination and repair protein Rad51-like C-terminal domain-containing protein n=1 Tax=Microthlaspi erraticum TaxID=1685480 RepID=A0A6D2L7E7_9BRAS|nr:unnamed protein product [Microthlaspi erraticum]